MIAQTVTIPDPNFSAYLQSIIPAAMSGNQMDTTNILVTTTTHTINVNNKSILNLSGIQYFDALTHLYCNQDSFPSIPRLPNSLVYLSCNNNPLLTSLPAFPNALKYIDCSGANLNSIPTLPNSLDTLYCYENNLTTIPMLPNGLRFLSCGQNSITNIPPLPSSINFLYLQNNQISCFPPFPNSITNINYFQIFGNPYNCLPNYISAMSPSDLAIPLCTAGNLNGCSISAPQICIVTTDSVTAYNYNIIHWDNTSYGNVDSFIIYRYDAISSSYLRIGSVNSTVSEFADTSFSIGGPNGGNPKFASWKYKLAIRDLSGNIGLQSPYHQTVFVQENNSNFSWNPYEIETGQGQINPVTGYGFLRDDTNNGNWQTLVTINGTATTDPNYASYPNGNWRIDALGFNCSSTYSKSHSNTNKQVQLTLESISTKKEITIYPNPTNGLFYIEANTSDKINLDLYDVSGKLLFSKDLNNKSNLDVTNLANGIYYITIKTNSQAVNKKLIIIR